MKACFLILTLIVGCSDVKTIEYTSLKINTSSIKETPLNAKTDSLCPPEMSQVEGVHCQNLYHKCLRWLDSENAIIRRCAVYSDKPVCKSKELKYFNNCIDKEEYTDIKSLIPKNNVSWTEAKALCEAGGKRLCKTDEWAFACEGNGWFPYPYGYKRRSDLCNIDRPKILDNRGRFFPQFENNDKYPDCLSSFGVHNLVGNVGEWTECSIKNKFKSCGVGGWWGGLRSRCRAITYGHDEFYRGIQVGFRCCKDL